MPSSEQVQLHKVTHTPSAAWCEACVSMNGRPDRHETDPTRICEREIPVLSFDFSYTGKSMAEKTMMVLSLQHWWCMIHTVVQ